MTISRCGPPPPPAYITDVQALADSQEAQKAKDRAPELYAKARDALDQAIAAHVGDDETLARSKALEASIVLKTAIAGARQKVAGARILAAQDRIARAGEDLERMRSLRLDAEQRFLSLVAFHDEQSDLATNLQSRFEADQQKVAKLDPAEIAAWEKVEQDRLARVLQGARCFVAAAEALGCAALVPSETGDTLSAIGNAGKALGDDWKILRPLVDDAALRAERLLVHTRAMSQPAPLDNPASDTKAVERFITALKGTGAMVSATRMGILVSIEDPLIEGQLSPSSVAVIVALDSALGDGIHPVLVQSWAPSGCAGSDCDAKSEDIAEAALTALGTTVKATARSWGNAPFSDPGHCLSGSCTAGRLDIVILAL